jgi:hypothetical protein
MALRVSLSQSGELLHREKKSSYLALALYHTLGFVSEDELALHFARIRDALRPAGVFLLRLAGPRLVPGSDPEPSKNWAEEKDGRFILSEKWYEGAYRIEHCIVIDTRKNELVEYHERRRAYSLGEVASMLQRAGYRRPRSCQDLDGTPATPKDFGLCVCHKAK